MIAELLYPKELKILIRKIELEGFLNKKSLKDLDSEVMFIGFFCVASVFAFYILFPSIYSILIPTFFTLMFCRNCVINSVQKDLIPYTIGSFVNGNIDKKHSDLVRGLFSISYSFSRDGDIKRGTVTTSKKEWENIDIGSVIVFINPRKGNCHAPYLPDRFSRICLDKRRIDNYSNKGIE